MVERSTLGFVAGATGLTGRSAVRALLDAGAGAVAHVRPDSPRLDAWRDTFEGWGAVLDATPWDAAAMQATLARLKPTVVFALLGTTKQRARAGDGDYQAVDFGLTRLLIEAAVASGAHPRIVYLSAVGVSAKARGAYYAARWQAEQVLRESGLPFVIARPSFIVGERDTPRPTERLGAGLIDAALGLAGALGARRIAARYRSTTGEELARALVRLGLAPPADRFVAEGFDLTDRNG